MKNNHQADLLGYIPSKLYLGLCFVTCGLYPYIWLRENARAFEKTSGGRVRELSARRLAFLGMTVQLILPFSIGAWIVWMATGSEVAGEVFRAAFFLFLALYFAVVFPMRCSNYFCARWALRSAVIEWDASGVMINRSIASWLKLFLLGSVYVQYHINRLMGLGMPGFADFSEIEGDATLLERLGDYLMTGKADRVAASWTKDNFEPEDDDEYGY